MTLSLSKQSLADASPEPPRRPLRIALAGYGVVGQALCARLAQEPDFKIVSILVRHPELDRAVPPPIPATSDICAFFSPPADLLVDVLSCERTGETVSSWALARGWHVVSASKRVISSSHRSLSETARRSGAKLLYSAAVGGGAPVLETVAESRERAPVESVAGILNGTVNYILTRLARGDTFDAALTQARLAGFAEEDPSADLSGADAAAKLRLIAQVAFDIDPAGLEVETEGLDKAAAERIAASGERWIQLATLSRSPAGLAARVSLQPRRSAECLPHVDDEWNSVAVALADGAVVRCLGPGAGGIPTAESILSDLRLLLPSETQADEKALAC